MNVFSWIVNLGVILLAAGIFLCSFHALSTLVEVAARLWKRMFVSWATRRLTDLGIVKTEEHRRQKTLDGKRLAVLIAIPVLALAVRDLLLSPLMIVFGLLLIAWMNFQSRQNERGRVNEDAELAALQMRSMLSVDRSLLNALNSIELEAMQTKGEKIHLLARIIGLADAIDAAVHPLRGKSLSLPQLAETLPLWQNRYDPALCFAVKQYLEDFILSNRVILNDGRQGEVIYRHYAFREPIIRTAEGEVVDLNREAGVQVEQYRL